MQDDPRLPPSLLDDEELVRLAEQDYAQQGTPPDDIQLEKAWQRFEKKRRGQFKPAPWLAAVAALLLAILYLARPASQPDFSPKGLPETHVSGLLGFERDAEGLRVLLGKIPEPYALLLDAGSKQELWKGAVQDWPQGGFVLTTPQPRKVCLLRGDSLANLESQLSLAREHELDTSLCADVP